MTYMQAMVLSILVIQRLKTAAHNVSTFQYLLFSDHLSPRKEMNMNERRKIVPTTANYFLPSLFLASSSAPIDPCLSISLLTPTAQYPPNTRAPSLSPLQAHPITHQRRGKTNYIIVGGLGQQPKVTHLQAQIPCCLYSRECKIAHKTDPLLYT